MTEIVTTAAVKKAYRKATLYVHPDKLQQRGASIQQKYTCEKVFDLLKVSVFFPSGSNCATPFLTCPQDPVVEVGLAILGIS